MVKKIFQIIGMHCSSCAMDIDGELEDTLGLKQSNTNYARQITEVEFDEHQLSDRQIVKIIEKIGYKVNAK